MLTLDSGNVLLKPSQRKQVLSWLRRALRLGQRMHQFAVSLTMHRAGRFYEVRILAHDSAGTLTCRARRHDWQDAIRDLARQLTHWLHDQQLALATRTA